MVTVVIVHSVLQTEDSVRTDMHSEIDLLSSQSAIKIIDLVSSPENARKSIQRLNHESSGLIILTATGGTEEIIEKFAKNVNLPVMLFAVSRKNSLAASLEAFAYLKEHFRVRLYVSENLQKDETEVKRFVKVCNAIKQINNARVGLIGEPSDWLLSSRDIKSFSNFSTELVKLPTSEIIDNVESTSESQSDAVFKKIKSAYPNSSVDDSSILESGKVYNAMKQIVTDHRLDSLSIRCFDLLDYKYTACMGMSMCNDEGIVSGCEGDIPATFTMMIGTYLTSEPCWMANPAVIDRSENTITFAHCTVPSKMIEDKSDANLTTHMESGLSTANQGKLRHTDVTIFRINSAFDKLSVSTGTIIKSDMREPSLCRTQAVVKLYGSITDWIENAPGNHHILVYGDLTEDLKAFCKFTDVQFILNM